VSSGPHRPAPGVDEGPTETDWFGNPLLPRARATVPCPRCGTPYDDRAALATHLRAEHDIRLPDAPPSRVGPGAGRLSRWWATVGHLPLWYVLLLDALLVAAVVTAAAPLGWWYASYGGGLATLPVVVVLSARLSHR